MFNPGFYDPYTREFYVVEKKEDLNGLKNLFPGTLFGIFIESSPTEVNHFRSVYSSLDLLGDVGGLHEILLIMANLLVSSFGQVTIFNQLIVKLFFTMPRTKPQDVNFSLDDP